MSETEFKLMNYRIEQAESAIITLRKENSESHKAIEDKLDKLTEAVVEQKVQNRVGTIFLSAIAGALSAMGVRKIWG